MKTITATVSHGCQKLQRRGLIITIIIVIYPSSSEMQNQTTYFFLLQKGRFRP